MNAVSPGAIVETTLAGEVVQLHAGRGLYWPRRRLLAIADLHLGKGDAFRRLGVALPRGGTALDLQRLDQLLTAFVPDTLLVLGDLLHGTIRDAAHWIDDWLSWRECHAALDVRVIRGNHDRALSATRLRIGDEGERCDLAPFAFVHVVRDRATGGWHEIGGHLHPLVTLRERGFSARLPVFWLRQQTSVLPAFTAFSGGSAVSAGAGERLYACAGDRLLAIPPVTRR